MNLKSVSGVSYRVRDVDVTAAFYQNLGFRSGKKDDVSTSIYLNWFWIEFYQVASEKAEKTAGQDAPVPPLQEVLLYLSVDDLAEAYQQLQGMGLSPTSEVANKAKGRREITILDPDGYRLVIFQKK